MTQFRAGAPQIMGCNMFHACSLAAGSDHVPDNVLRDAMAPHLSQSGDRSKDFALTNPSGLRPLIEGGFHPVRNGHGPYVATFANQVNHGPVSLAHLDVVQFQTNQFRPSKTTTKQHGQHCVIALRAHTVTTSALKYFRTLLWLNQLPDRNPSCLTPLTRLIPAANSGLSKPAAAAS